MIKTKNAQVKIPDNIRKKLDDLENAPNKQFLTEDQKQAIIEYYPYKKVQDIADVLGVSLNKVRRCFQAYIRTLGLKTVEEYKQYLEEHKK